MESIFSCKPLMLYAHLNDTQKYVCSFAVTLAMQHSFVFVLVYLLNVGTGTIDTLASSSFGGLDHSTSSASVPDAGSRDLSTPVTIGQEYLLLFLANQIHVFAHKLDSFAIEWL